VGKNRAIVLRFGFGRDSAIGRTSTQASIAQPLTVSDHKGITDLDEAVLDIGAGRLGKKGIEKISYKRGTDSRVGPLKQNLLESSRV
jgi:hypothetical protein